MPVRPLVRRSVRKTLPQERRVLVGAFVVGVVMAAGVGAMSSDALDPFALLRTRVVDATGPGGGAPTDGLVPGAASSSVERGRRGSSAPVEVRAVGAVDTVLAGAPAPGSTGVDEEESSTPSIDELIADLRDDDEIGNAAAAYWALERCGLAATLGLASALESDDRQQRHYAAMLIDERGDPLPPRIYDVAVEALADDDLHTANAQWALRFLDAHPEAAHERLARALFTSDRQQRFLAAYLLARTGVELTRAQACAVLIEHLADNETPCDAELARDALTQLSYLVLPQISVAARAPADRQSREYLERIQIDIVRRAPFARPGQAAWLGTRSRLPYGCVWGEY